MLAFRLLRFNLSSLFLVLFAQRLSFDLFFRNSCHVFVSVVNAFAESGHLLLVFGRSFLRLPAFRRLLKHLRAYHSQLHVHFFEELIVFSNVSRLILLDPFDLALELRYFLVEDGIVWS